LIIPSNTSEPPKALRRTRSHTSTPVQLSSSQKSSTSSSLQSSPAIERSNIKEEEIVDEKFSENDLLVMGIKLGILQQTNFELEQQVNKLQIEVKKLREESSKKSRVIAKHMKGIKIQGRSTTEMDRNKREIIQAKSSESPLAFMGTIFGGNDPLQEEMHYKMGTVLEDTLMQNIQLQDDIKEIGEDVERLLAENKSLKDEVLKLQRIIDQTILK